jgi:hypothetical protein
VTEKPRDTAYEEEIGRQNALHVLDETGSEPIKNRLTVLGFLSVVGILGGLFYHSCMPIPSSVTDLWKSVHRENWGKFVGILMLGMFLVNLLTYALMWFFDWATETVRNHPVLPPVFVGLIESLIYPLSYLLEPRFIPVWLGVKTISVWREWSGGQRGRRAFNRYLYGTGLSLLANGVTYGFLKSYVDPR